MKNIKLLKNGVPKETQEAPMGYCYFEKAANDPFPNTDNLFDHFSKRDT